MYIHDIYLIYDICNKYVYIHIYCIYIYIYDIYIYMIPIYIYCEIKKNLISIYIISSSNHQQLAVESPALLVAHTGAVLDEALDDAGGHLTIATGIQWGCSHHALGPCYGEIGNGKTMPCLPPMTGKGQRTTYKNGHDWRMV